MNNKLRNILIGTGVAAIGAIGTKKAVDYFRDRQQKETVPETTEDQEPQSDEELAYAVVEPSSVQDFLDQTFGEPGRYVPNQQPRIFDYQGKQYMVIWADDTKNNKQQLLAFMYTDAGREMVASVGYTPSKTDYNLKLSQTPFAVEVNDQKLTGGAGETQGTKEVDFVLA